MSATQSSTRTDETDRTDRFDHIGATGANSLLDFSRLLNRSVDLDGLYDAYLLSLIGRLGLTRAAVAVRTDEPDIYEVRYLRTPRSIVPHLHGLRLRFDDTTPPLARLAPFLPVTHLSIVPPALLPDHLPSIGIHHILPLRFDRQTLAIALLGNPVIAGTDSFNRESAAYATALSAITAVAVEGIDVRAELRTVNRRLERRVRRLHSVFESGQIFDISMEPGEIIAIFGYTLMGEMALTRYALFVEEGEIDDATGEMRRLRRVVDRFEEGPTDDDVSDLLASGQRLVDEKTEPDLYRQGIRGVVPLRSHGERRGLLLVGPRLGFPFDEEDLEYVGALGRLALGTIENRRLLDEALETKRIEEDLRIARDVQQGLLPPVPTIKGYSIAAGTISAREVGGDSYDLIRTPSGRILVTMADVAGKGIPAALLMANAQAAIRALAPLDLPLDELVTRINRLLVENTRFETFVTALFLLFDPASGQIDYVNAGHNRPMLLSDSGCRELTEGGILLGVIEEPKPYRIGSVTMKEGDLLFLYTDGVTEGVDRSGEQFGTERLAETLAELRRDGADADGIRRGLLERLATYSGDDPAPDDITTLAIVRDRT